MLRWSRKAESRTEGKDVYGESERRRERMVNVIFIICNIMYITQPIPITWLSITCRHNEQRAEGTECWTLASMCRIQ